VLDISMLWLFVASRSSCISYVSVKSRSLSYFTSRRPTLSVTALVPHVVKLHVLTNDTVFPHKL